MSVRRIAPEWQNDLAGAHMNRGVLLSNQDQSSEALADYNESIRIIRELRDTMGEQFSPEWQNALAIAFYNLGLLLLSLNKEEEAGQNFLQSNQLGAELIQRFQDQTPDFWRQVFDNSGQQCQELGLIDVS